MTAMKPLRFILAAVILASLTACSVTRHRPYSVESTRLNLAMSDLEYVGETEISVDYRQYIGFIPVIDSINGTAYDGVEIKSTRIGNAPAGLYGKLNRAAYKLVEDFPEAEYFLVVSQDKTITRLFLGSDIKVKARVKAYKFK